MDVQRLLNKYLTNDQMLGCPGNIIMNKCCSIAYTICPETAIRKINDKLESNSFKKINKHMQRLIPNMENRILNRRDSLYNLYEPILIALNLSKKYVDYCRTTTGFTLEKHEMTSFLLWAHGSSRYTSVHDFKLTFILPFNRLMILLNLVSNFRLLKIDKHQYKYIFKFMDFIICPSKNKMIFYSHFMFNYEPNAPQLSLPLKPFTIDSIKLHYEPIINEFEKYQKQILNGITPIFSPEFLDIAIFMSNIKFDEHLCHHDSKIKKLAYLCHFNAIQDSIDLLFHKEITKSLWAKK